jgi:hypothetical protein
MALALACATAATLVAALAESWNAQHTDNLRVGVAASVTVVTVHYLCAGWFVA